MRKRPSSPSPPLSEHKIHFALAQIAEQNTAIILLLNTLSQQVSELCAKRSEINRLRDSIVELRAEKIELRRQVRELTNALNT